MDLTPEQKEHAVDLIEVGDQLEAVRYLQQTLLISSDKALVLCEKLKQEIESPALDESTSFDGATGEPTLDVGRLVGSIFMGIGCIMLAVTAYLAVSNYKFEQRAQPAKGKVIKYDSYESPNKDGRAPTTMYTPTFTYTFNGKAYQYKSSTSTSNKEFEIGEVVDMLVDPKEPQSILINTFWDEWFLPVLLGCMGILFTGIGFGAFRVFGKSA